jgi:hypothetical protein
MKRLLLLLLIAAAPVQVNAQSVSLSLHGGMSFPVLPTEFYDYWSPGYNVAGGVTYYLLPFLELRGEVEYVEFQLDELALLVEAEVPAGLVTITGGAVSAVMFTGSLKVLPLPSAPIVRPYVLVGGGLAALSVSDVTVSALGVSEQVSGASEKAGLILGGIGMDVVLSPTIDVFAEGRFLYLFTEDEASSFVPASLGIRIKF